MVENQRDKKLGIAGYNVNLCAVRHFMQTLPNQKKKLIVDR